MNHKQDEIHLKLTPWTSLLLPYVAQYTRLWWSSFHEWWVPIGRLGILLYLQRRKLLGGEVGDDNAQFPNHVLCRRLWIPHSGWVRGFIRLASLQPRQLWDVETVARSTSHSLSCGVTHVPANVRNGEKADEMSHTCAPFFPHRRSVLFWFPWYASFQWPQFPMWILAPKERVSLMAVSYRRLGNSFCDIVSQYPFRTNTW